MKHFKSPLKVECFFIANIIFAIFLDDLFFVHLCAVIALVLVFIKEKIKFPLIILIIMLKLFLHYSCIIIDVDSANKAGIKYITTNGKIVLNDYYESGVVIFKKDFTNSKEVEMSYKLPLISRILQFRKNFSESLYINSNGVIKLTQALTVGDRTYIPIEINDIFIITGIIHLLAISGLHVAMITTLFFFLLFFIPKKLRYLIISLLLLFYIPLAAFKVPVSRASLCAIIIMMLFFFEIKVDYRKFLLFIASFFIILSPTHIMDLSFIMSFLAVAGIVYLGFSSKNRLLNAIYIGLAAQTVVIPVTLYTFGMTNICSVLTTVIILPVININVFIGLLSIINPGLFAPLLIYIEKAILYLVNYFYLYTYNAFFLYKINTLIFLCMLCIIIIVFYMPKYRFLIFTIYLFLLVPVDNKRGIYTMKEYSNLFIISLSNNNELYFKGDYYFYKYKLLPQLAKMKIKTFNSGKILLKNGQNNYIRFNHQDKLNTVCINKWTSNCNVLYKKGYLQMQSNSLKKYHKINSGTLIFIPFNDYF